MATVLSSWMMALFAGTLAMGASLLELLEKG